VTGTALRLIVNSWISTIWSLALSPGGGVDDIGVGRQ
jgi:hypothetical protein